MPDYMLPFTKILNMQDGTIPDAVLIQKRYLADLKGLYANSAAESALMASNPLLYEVHEATDIPEVIGQLRYSTTIIYPGKVGDEYFFTKGHYHALADRAELYFGLVGEGYLLLQTPEGEINAQHMTPGAMTYVPPYWAHRTINTGTGNFAFMACYSADAGYNYGPIAENGFAQLMIERDGKPALVVNPRWKR